MPPHETPDSLPPGFQPADHLGHWELRHLTLAADRPGDVASVRSPGYAEQELDEGQRESDMRIGERIAAAERPCAALIVAAATRQVQAWNAAGDNSRPSWLAQEAWADGMEAAADLVGAADQETAGRLP